MFASMTPLRRGPSQQRESNVTERAAASFFGLFTVFLVSHRLRLLRCGDSLPSRRGRCLCPAPFNSISSALSVLACRCPMNHVPTCRNLYLIEEAWMFLFTLFKTELQLLLLGRSTTLFQLHNSVGELSPLLFDSSR